MSKGARLILQDLKQKLIEIEQEIEVYEGVDEYGYGQIVGIEEGLLRAVEIVEKYIK
jgi:hypothetical protein